MLSRAYNDRDSHRITEVSGTPADLEEYARQLTALAEACKAAAYYGPGEVRTDGYGVRVECRAERKEADRG